VKKRKKSKLKTSNVFYAILFLVAVMAILAGLAYLPNRLKSEVIIEAGKVSRLYESQFIKTEDEGSFENDIEKIDLAVPGDYIVKVKVGFLTYRSHLIINDTTTPTLVLRELVAPLGKELNPEDFVEDANDNTQLTYRFIKAPDTTSIGEQTVTIEAKDLGSNTIVKDTTVLISQVKDKVTVEAGSGIPKIEDFLLEAKTNEVFITDLNKLKLSVGDFPIEIKMGERILTTTLEVRDTIAPQAKTVSQTVYIGDKIDASRLVTSIVDATPVTVSFKESTAWTATEGTYHPILMLTDAGKNQTELTSTLIVRRDTEAPVLSGAGLRDRTVYVGESFSVKSQVYANDNRDGRVTVSVSGSVNFSRVGSYPITFSAKDKAGNIATKRITVNVITHPPFVSKGDTGSAELNQLVDRIFADHLHGDMSTYQVAQILYTFGRSIRYQAGPLASEWRSRAISSLTTRTGNCFGRMYAMEALFVRAGIANREQVQYDQEHSWNQINIGNGWQNVDVGYSVFLQSDSFLKNKALASSTIADDTWETSAPVPTGTVIVTHVDETSGSSIASSVTLSGPVGSDYSTSVKVITGYTFVSSVGNTSGKFSESTITVVYRYRQTTP